VASGGGQPVAVPPPLAAPDVGGPGGWRRYALAAGFLAPAALFLGVWIVYPALRTAYRSFFDRQGDEFVFLDNYTAIFENDLLLTSVKNNAIWVLVVPALVTALGLVFAVLTERVGWAVAFKTAVFMPMAISAFAAGITWRLVYIEEPERGALNAMLRSAHDTVVGSAGVLSDASPSSPALAAAPGGGLILKDTVRPGQSALLGLTGISTSEVPDSAEQAAVPPPSPGEITGVVWRDFKPGGGIPGRVEEEELGLPGVTVELLDGDGEGAGKTRTADDGSFAFEDLEPGEYRVSVAGDTFAKAYAGVSWLGPKLVTPSIIIAYIWIWAGFAMVVIGAGLAAMPRDVLEAARTDGASEWQVFRRVTIPLLAPVLTVVFVTMLINVLKVFDIVISIAPGSVQDDASVLALGMWRTAFGGANDFGVGSAIAVFLFLLVIPILLFNIRSFRREA
jgi:alpha-glucoside transport system permease protein